MRVGCIGLGTMGFPMASRIIQAGHDVVAMSRSPGPAQALAEEGASSVPTAAAVSERSDVIILSLPDDDAVASVVRSLLDQLSGMVIADCSTISPRTARLLSEEVSGAGGDYLDAPVSGGPYGAAAGTLSVMVGGDPAALDRVRPALDAFSALIAHVGPAGAGQVVKLANQIIVGAQVLALSEAVLFAERSGVSPAELHRVLIQSTGDSHMARTRFPAPGVIPGSPASNAWRPDFTTALMAKDLDLALTYGGQLGAPLLSTGIVRALLAASTHAGNGDRDWSAFHEVLRGGDM